MRSVCDSLAVYGRFAGFRRWFSESGLPIGTPKKLQCTALADSILIDVSRRVNILSRSKQGSHHVHRSASSTFKPKLAIVLLMEDTKRKQDIPMYVKEMVRTGGRVGIECTLVGLPRADADSQVPERVASAQAEVMRVIEKLNRDDSYHGILLCLPMPFPNDSNAVVFALRPEKDVDGLHVQNLGATMTGQMDKGFAPGVPVAIIELLEMHRISWSGKHVVVVGRSPYIGRPLASLMERHIWPRLGATVTHCEFNQPEMASVTKQADILIAACGEPNLIRPELVKPGVVVIDVGISEIDDRGRNMSSVLPSVKRRMKAEGARLRVVGDVDPAVHRISSAYTSVPGGIGPVTVAVLMRHTILAAERLCLQ